ncbi:MAG: hypothetical protein Q8O99_05260 [bacterium]|nr:hypothetical protein [bacterium]
MHGVQIGQDGEADHVPFRKELLDQLLKLLVEQKLLVKNGEDETVLYQLTVLGKLRVNLSTEEKPTELVLISRKGEALQTWIGASQIANFGPHMTKSWREQLYILRNKAILLKWEHTPPKTSGDLFLEFHPKEQLQYALYCFHDGKREDI